MTEQVQPGVFLERRSYRRRRLLDAIKLLPILAAWLFVLPVLWPGASGDAVVTRTTSDALKYIFGGWLLLTLLTALFLKGYARLTDPEPEETPEGER